MRAVPFFGGLDLAGETADSTEGLAHAVLEVKSYYGAALDTFSAAHSVNDVVTDVEAHDYTGALTDGVSGVFSVASAVTGLSDDSSSGGASDTSF